MINNVFRKSLAIGIIILFFVASVLPSISGDINKINDIKNDESTDKVYDWPMFHHDINHTGYTDGKGNISYPAKKWSYTTDGMVASSPALGDIDGDGEIEVVVGSDDNNVYAIDGITGNKEWVYLTGSNVHSSPALGDIDYDNIIEVVVGSNDGKVYALNGTNGQVDWTYTTGFLVFSSPALGDIDYDNIIEVVVGSVDCDFLN